MTQISQSKIEKKRLEILCRQHQVALPGNLLVAFCTMAFFFRQLPRPILAGWFLAMAVVLLIRFFLIRFYEKQPAKTLTPRPWLIKFGMSIFLNGLLWGVLGVYTHLHVPLVYFFIALIIIAGVVAAALAINSVSIFLFLSFVLPATLPASFSLLISADFEQMVMGILLLAYVGVMTRSAIGLNRVILTSIQYRYENLKLLDHLKEEQIQIRALNARLAQDIEKRKKTEMEKERLIQQLQKALKDVNTLSGMIPICANCKKVRDDKGYWDQIESYIHKHSGADFSHGICPECAKKLYPDVDLSEDE